MRAEVEGENPAHIDVLMHWGEILRLVASLKAGGAVRHAEEARQPVLSTVHPERFREMPAHAVGRRHKKTASLMAAEPISRRRGAA